MRSYILILVVLLLYSCKAQISLSEIPDLDKDDSYYPHDYPPPMGEDVTGGVVKDEKGKMIALAAIKLVINDSVCVNAYSNFDGNFSFMYDKKMINTNSHIIALFEGYSKKIVPFKKFKRSKLVTLDKSGDVVNHDEYRSFYESIRSCTR
ncbi:hypothetical protein [Aquimarina sp. I32.4]|uniref:hypothetical protein n=1 Tax=Aquimarina sp. I32.4 TaxID=2053903 RepID=UPI000CDEDEA3|nr:hypothetical protein [Aquimarina sp. I32.4]